MNESGRELCRSFADVNRVSSVTSSIIERILYSRECASKQRARAGARSDWLSWSQSTGTHDSTAMIDCDPRPTMISLLIATTHDDGGGGEQKEQK
jgi:hypothetical protein